MPISCLGPRRLFKVVGLVLLFGPWIAPAAAQDAHNAARPPELAAGDSLHGEEFNEGPRQKAYLMKNTGNISFPVTTKNPLVQEFINQGVGQLHGFWYFEAERSFRQAAMLDPECAIAYWGMALANANNETRAKKFIASAVKYRAKAGDREQLYIDALSAFHNAKDRGKVRAEAYVKALERILYKYPDDVEAKAFLAVQFWHNRGAGVPIQSYHAVDALLGDVFRANPMHPAHHYRIHLWDGEKTDNALGSAALCGQAAPGIAHMWHMSGHIFAGLRRYSDAAWQQEASARVDHAHMIRDRVLPDQIHNFAHNNEWLIRDLNHIGRVHDAVTLAQNMIELPRHPKYNTPTRGGSSNFGRQRLYETLIRYEQWPHMIAACNGPHLDPTDNEDEQIKRLRQLGSAYVRAGDLESGRAQRGALQHRLDSVQASAKANAKGNAKGAVSGNARNLENAIAEIDGHLAVAAGDFKTGLSLLRKSGDVESSYLTLVQWQAGERDGAINAARSRVNSHRNEVQPLAVLVDLLWRSDRKKEAAEEFAKLRELSRELDLDAPAFARLVPLAKELNLPSDWRIIKPPAGDVGNRPSLDSLGPLRWHPTPAAEWTLADAQGKNHSLRDYHGRPVVVIFYLGYGCLHCAKQLEAFAAMQKDFAAAGISLIAVSTDDREGLKKSLESYKQGTFPFPLVSDSAKNTFKLYRAHDDFEDQPLHGTFLIDGDGLVRWQDISFEPFTDAKFVLEESRRLLSLPADKPPSSSAPKIASPRK